MASVTPMATSPTVADGWVTGDFISQDALAENADGWIEQRTINTLGEITAGWSAASSAVFDITRRFGLENWFVFAYEGFTLINTPSRCAGSGIECVGDCVIPRVNISLKTICLPVC